MEKAVCVAYPSVGWGSHPPVTVSSDTPEIAAALGGAEENEGHSRRSTTGVDATTATEVAAARDGSADPWMVAHSDPWAYASWTGGNDRRSWDQWHGGDWSWSTWSSWGSRD